MKELTIEETKMVMEKLNINKKVITPNNFNNAMKIE